MFHLFVFELRRPAVLFYSPEMGSADYVVASAIETCVGSTHLPCSRIKSFRRSTASASGMLNFTDCLPTYRFTLPGAPPTYPKSASAISPGPFTMQPMIAIFTPLRCNVAALIFAVVVWRLNKVRPHDGHAT